MARSVDPQFFPEQITRFMAVVGFREGLRAIRSATWARALVLSIPVPHGRPRGRLVELIGVIPKLVMNGSYTIKGTPQARRKQAPRFLTGKISEAQQRSEKNSS